MKQYSPLTKILMLIAFFIIASFVVSGLFHLAGGLLHFVFKYGIPLLIAVWVVNWLTKRQKRR